MFLGSDDWNLYVWRVPIAHQNKPRLYNRFASYRLLVVILARFVHQADVVLKGHRSIVNQVRYSQCNQLVASSGVEKIIKVTL
jgi:WD repeat-containing protein 22